MDVVPLLQHYLSVDEFGETFPAELRGPIAARLYAASEDAWAGSAMLLLLKHLVGCWIRSVLTWCTFTRSRAASHSAWSAK